MNSLFSDTIDKLEEESNESDMIKWAYKNDTS